MRLKAMKYAGSYADSMPGRWFVSSNDNGVGYVHADGVIRPYAFHEGQPTGWFKTRAQARAAAKLARQKLDNPVNA